MRNVLAALLALLALPAIAQAQPINPIPDLTYSIDVKALGADNTCTSDVSVVFQQAQVKASASTPPKSIYLPPGCYLQTNRLNGVSGITWWATPGTVIWRAGQAAGSPAQALLMYIGTGVTNITFIGMDFDGGMSVVGVSLPLFFPFSASNIRWIDTGFTNNRVSFINTTLCDSCVLERPRVYNAGQWWHSGGTWQDGLNPFFTWSKGTHGAIRGMRAYDRVGGDIADVTGHKGFQYTDNYCVISGTKWLNMQTGAGGGCIYTFSGNGSTATPNTGTIIANNYCEGVTGNCYDISADSGVFVNNYAYKAGGAGISLTANATPNVAVLTNYTISNSVVLDSYQAAVGQTTATTTADLPNGGQLIQVDSTAGLHSGDYVSGSPYIFIPETMTVTDATHITIQYGTSGGTTIAGTKLYFHPVYPIPPALRGGLVLGVRPYGASATISNLTINNMILGDDQGAAATQQWAIQAFPGLSLPGVTATNIHASGNAQGMINTAGVFNEPIADTPLIYLATGRNAGWVPMTGTPDKSTVFDTGSVTLPQLAGRVMQLQSLLAAQGLIQP